ncbi:PspC domain-containing protein [Glutamicibacter mishrai]|uniref:PspC domain-containing protein n=1 Tax=Glutamicibacter mishrai TaxID=1775880 RepID=UPI0032EBEC3F
MNNSGSERQGFFSQLSKSPFIRQESRWLGGVAAGVADYFKIDVILARGIIVVLSFLGGLGLILYGLAWALLPDQQGRIHLERAINKEWTSGMTGSVVLVVLGIFPAQWILDSVAPVLWPIAIVAAVLFIIFSRKNTKFDRPRPAKPAKTQSQPSSTAHTTAMEKPWRKDGFTFSSSAPSGAEPATKSMKDQEDTMASDIPDPKPHSGGYEYAYSPDPKYTRSYSQEYFHTKAARKAQAAPPIPSWVATTVVGLSILVIAAVLCADYLHIVDLPGSGWGIALAAGLLVTGLAIVLASLVRRTSGGLLGLGIPLLVMTLVFSGSSFGTEDRQAVRSEPGGNEYSAVFSRSTIDLTYLDSITTPTTVEVDSLFSRLDLKLPANVPVKVTSDGVFNSQMDLELPQDQRQLPDDAPLLTVEVDGLFSSFGTEVATTATPTVVTPEF